MSKKFKALAYMGVHQLRDLGDFDTNQEALDKLSDELERQLENEESIDHEDITESFWANSQID